MKGLQPIRHRLVVGIIRDLDCAIELVGELLHAHDTPYLPFLMSPQIPQGWLGTLTTGAISVIAEVKGVKLIAGPEQLHLPKHASAAADALHPVALLEKLIDQNPDIFWPLIDAHEHAAAPLLGMQLTHQATGDNERSIVDTVLRYASDRVHLLDIR